MDFPRQPTIYFGVEVGVNLTSPTGTPIDEDDRCGFGNTSASPRLLHISLRGEADITPMVMGSPQSKARHHP